jgi:hypothetical protein
VPFYTGLAFAIPLVISVYFLEKIPPPTEEDLLSRSRRLPMSKEDRKNAVSHFFFGLLLCISIIGLPFGKKHFQMIELSLMPFGKKIVNA